MKRIINAILALSLVASLTVSCDLFKLDNQEGPDAQLVGKLIDPAGEQIQVEACLVDSRIIFWGIVWGGSIDYKGGVLTVIEDVSDRWEDSFEKQYWFVRFDGSYTNNMVFAGKYQVNFEKIPVFQDNATTNIELKKGENKIDFTLKPYSYIYDENISYNDGVITAKFKIKSGDPSKADFIRKVALFSSTSNFVGSFTNVTKVEMEPKKGGNWWAPTYEPLPLDTELTLTIDTKNDTTGEFKYDRDHYLRIGVVFGDQAKTINPEDIYNFSPIYKMDRQHNITKYDWATAK